MKKLEKGSLLFNKYLLYFSKYWNEKGIVFGMELIDIF